MDGDKLFESVWFKSEQENMKESNYKKKIQGEKEGEREVMKDKDKGDKETVEYYLWSS